MFIDSHDLSKVFDLFPRNFKEHRDVDDQSGGRHGCHVDDDSVLEHQARTFRICDFPEDGRNGGQAYEGNNITDRVDKVGEDADVSKYL